MPGLVTIVPRSEEKKNWTIRFEAGMGMICNAWIGRVCEGHPSTARVNSSAQVFLTRENLTLAYNCQLIQRASKRK